MGMCQILKKMSLLNTNYISNNYKSQTAYVENNLYKMSDHITCNNTNTYLTI